MIHLPDRELGGDEDGADGAARREEADAPRLARRARTAARSRRRGRRSRRPTRRDGGRAAEARPSDGRSAAVRERRRRLGLHADERVGAGRVDSRSRYTGDRFAGAAPAFLTLMDYAIISLGGKQYRVREGETLVVDRVQDRRGQDVRAGRAARRDGDGRPRRCVAHERGPKIRIGKYQQAHRLQAAQRLPRGDLPHRDLARRRRSARPPKKAEADGGRRRREAEAPQADEPDVEGHAERLRGDDGRADRRGREDVEPPELEAALAYEQAHAARKGALAALESALKAKEEDA